MPTSFDPNDETGEGDLTDLLGELRVLLPAAQLLSGFLIAVPFAPGFSRLVGSEQHIFLATFIFSLISLRHRQHRGRRLGTLIAVTWWVLPWWLRGRGHV